MQISSKGCIPCFRIKPKLALQIMGDLPKERVTFEVTGVDLSKPVRTTSKFRGKASITTYICRSALHQKGCIRSTDSFLPTLQRFVSRSSFPRVIWRDKATNFVWTANLWTPVNKRKIQEEAAKTGMEFKFIPPRAPHMGGLWEAAVKSAKVLMLKTMGEASLTYEELSTLLAEIEAVLNSRPIGSLSPDPNDEVALTPGHLLIGRGLKTLPEVEERGNKVGSLSRYRRLTLLRGHFWNVWRKDYLGSMQQRAKWSEAGRNIEVGELVVIHEENLPPMQWLVGRVMEVVAGADGKVRVAVVKTNSGIFKRPIHKLAPLPLDEVSQDPLPAKEPVLRQIA